MVWGAAIGAGASLAQGVLGSFQQQNQLKEQAREARRQAEYQEKMAFQGHLDQIAGASNALVAEIQRQGDLRSNAIYSNTFQNLMIKYSNERTEDIYGEQVELFKERSIYQDIAAYEAYAQNERRLDEIYTAANFQMSKDQRNLANSVGSYVVANEGDRGASYELAAEKETYAKFGLSAAELTESLSSADAQMDAENDNIRRSALNQRLADKAQIAIPPMLQAQLPPPQFSSMPTGGAASVGAYQRTVQMPKTPKYNMGLSIAGAAMGAVGQFAQMGGFNNQSTFKAPERKWGGIPYALP